MAASTLSLQALSAGLGATIRRFGGCERVGWNPFVCEDTARGLLSVNEIN